MKIPVDNVVEVLTTAVDIKAAAKQVVSVNVLIDETSSPELQAFVRSGFTSDSPNSRLMVSYFPTQTPDASVASDIVVIVAGSSPDVGRIASDYSQACEKVLVITDQASQVMDAAAAGGNPLSPDNVISCEGGFDEQLKTQLSELIGRWIVGNVDEKERLAFSLAFPFVRRPLALDAINRTSVQNAGLGVVVFIPVADMAVMTANQIKMVLQIAAAYGQPLDADRIKELVVVVLNAFLCRGVARELSRFVPVLGWAIKGGIGYAGTWSIGHAALEYFEAGGDAAGVAAIAAKAVKGAQEAAAVVQGEATEVAADGSVGPLAKRMGNAALGKMAEVAQSAAETTVSNAGSLFTRRKKAK